MSQRLLSHNSTPYRRVRGRKLAEPFVVDGSRYDQYDVTAVVKLDLARIGDTLVSGSQKRQDKPQRNKIERATQTKHLKH